MKTAALPLVCLLALTTSLHAQTAPTTQAAPQAAAWPDNNTQATVEQLQAKGKFIREALRNLTGSSRLNNDLLQKRLDDIVLQLDHNELQLIETHARRKAVATKIQELSTNGEGSAAHDPVLQQLATVADARDRAAKRNAQLVTTGAGVSAAEMESAVADAAEAHAKVEERREAVAASIGGGILPALNRQLVELSLQEDVLSQMQRALQDKRDRLQEADRLSLELNDVVANLAARYHRSLDD
jgi:hypothetical protein